MNRRVWRSARTARRARDVAAGHPASAELYATAIEPLTGRGMAAAVGYWAALLAGERAAGRRSGPDYDAAFAGERRMQARWLRRELSLTD